MGNEFQSVLQLIRKYVEDINSSSVRIIALDYSGNYLLRNKVSAISDFFGISADIKYYNCNNKEGVPYYPFIDLTEENLKLKNKNENEIKKVLGEKKVYFAHKDIFLNFILNGTTVRNEEIQKEEIFYERKMMVQNFENLLSGSKEKPAIVLIENSDLLSESSLVLLEKIQKNGKIGNFIFVLGFNGDKQKIETGAWEEFLKRNSTSIFITKLTSRLDKEEKIEEAASLQLNDAENLFNFLCINESMDVLKDCSGKISEEIDLQRYFLLMGNIYKFKEEYEQADEFYQKYLNSVLNTNSIRKCAEAHILIGQLHIEKGNSEDGLKSAHLAMSFYEKLDKKDKNLRCRIEYVRIFALSELRYRFPDEFKKTYKESIDLFKNAKRYNQYLSLVSRALTSHYVYEEFEKTLEVCNLAIRLAKRVKNYAKLGSLLHVKGIIYSSTGKARESFEWYKKSERIKVKVGDISEIIRIQNGLGFVFFLAENYKSALRYFDKAIGYVSDKSDYKEMCVTIFNSAQVSFFAMNYENAVEYLEKTLSITGIMKFIEIPFHSVAGINALLGLAYFKTENMSKAEECFQKAENLKNYLKIDEILYFGLLEILLRYERFDKNEITIKYDYLNKYIAEHKLFHFYSFISFEVGSILLRAGRTHEALEILKQGLKISEGYQYEIYTSLIASIISGEKSGYKPISMKLRKIDLQSVIEHAEKMAVYNKLQKRVGEIDFLTNLQNLFLNTSFAIPIMAEKYVQLIKSYFFVDKCLIYILDEGVFKSLVSTSDSEDITQDFLRNGVSSKKDKIIYNNQIEKDGKERYNSMIISPLITAGEVEGAVLFITEQSEVQFNEDEMYILGISAKQFMLSLTNKRLQEKLKELALKDGLTTLYNHKTIFELLEKEIHFAIRFKKNLSIIMMDIDHFKTINDTYGHSTGDIVLRKTAEEIKKSVRNVDICGRYGGEEFIVILPESNISEAAIVAERIRNNVEKMEFEQGIKVTISGGIKEFESKLDIALFIEGADKKLYDAKHNGRNRMEI